MARILYAINGEGMGHALRSKVIIDHLLTEGHELKIVSSGRAFDFFASRYPLVEDIHYMHIVYKKNQVRSLRTIYENVKKFPRGSWKSFKKLWRIVRGFKPEVIITDFEPFSDIIAKVFRVPLIAIDNINMLVKGKITVPKMQLFWYLLAKGISRTFIFAADYYIIPSFFHVPVKRSYKTDLVPPAIREEILAATVAEKDHILVYQTAGPTEELFKTLKNIDEHFVVCGAKEDKKWGNITLRSFSEKQFIDDLRTCKAVITNGGFTLMSEAIYLHKPVLSVPVERQFEQIMNALYLQEYGYGMYEKVLTLGALRRFLRNLDDYKQRLSTYKQDGNEKLFHLLDQRIKQVVYATSQ